MRFFRARWVAVLVTVVTVTVMVVLRARAQGSAPRDPERGPTLEWVRQVHARTAAATRLRFRAELVVDGDAGGVVRLVDEGGLDDVEQRLWRRVTLVRGDEALPSFQIVADRHGLYVQPGHAAARLGLAPDAWVGAATDEAPLAWRPGALSGSARLVRDLLRKASGEVTVAGDETVRGVATTHVRVTASGAGVARRTDALPVDVWVDGDQRVRQIEVVIDVGRDNGSSPSRLRLRLELFDYDQPVEVEFPDPAEVVSNDLQLVRQILIGFGHD